MYYYIDKASEELKKDIIKNSADLFEYIKNPSEEIQMEAVKQHGSLIQYIKNPSEKVIRAAILNGATKKDLMHILNIDRNKISDELWLQIQLM